MQISIVCKFNAAEQDALIAAGETCGDRLTELAMLNVAPGGVTSRQALECMQALNSAPNKGADLDKALRILDNARELCIAYSA